MPRIEKRVKLLNSHGLHARPSGQIAEAAKRFTSMVQLARDGLVVDAKSVIELLLLASPCGTEMDLIADGPDAEEAVATINQLFVSRFGHLDVDS